MGTQDWLHGPGVYKLGLVMSQRVEIIAIYLMIDLYQPSKTARGRADITIGTG